MGSSEKSTVRTQQCRALTRQRGLGLSGPRGRGRTSQNLQSKQGPQGHHSCGTGDSGEPSIPETQGQRGRERWGVGGGVVKAGCRWGGEGKGGVQVGGRGGEGGVQVGEEVNWGAALGGNEGWVQAGEEVKVGCRCGEKVKAGDSWGEEKLCGWYGAQGRGFITGTRLRPREPRGRCWADSAALAVPAPPSADLCRVRGAGPMQRAGGLSRPLGSLVSNLVCAEGKWSPNLDGSPTEGPLL